MIHYTDQVLWWCDICNDEGSAESDHAARRQAEQHECIPEENDG